MGLESQDSIFKEVDLQSKTNNTEHHTSEISVDELIVRRGQPFTLTLKLTQPFNPDLYPLALIAVTGQSPSEDRGTKSCFGIPDIVKSSPPAKAAWNVALHKSSIPQMGILSLTVTPPANTPIGQHTLSVSHRDNEAVLGTLVVLFNPWCPDDWVFLSDESERQEYVINEQGIIYTGNGNYISSIIWDFGQFENNMVNICLKILDLNPKYIKDPAKDVSARCNPVYVSRVVTAMINCLDDHGVLEGNWGNSFRGGVPPSQWNGSYPILKQWFNIGCHPVKYGQCWVFAGVMCSVMRLLGIPCRVVTNFQSAHDTNKNLIVDEYHADYGVREKETKDSVWNYHVWVEGWMKRPDLGNQYGKYDGWQVLDPTPQEKSEGVYCCGPAPVKAILCGDTNLKYDVPFVFAEVNADCIDWLVKADGSEVKIFCDSHRVGQNISTKYVGANKRMDITHTYKYREGSEEERAAFKHGVSSNIEDEEETESKKDEVSPVLMRFEEVSKPRNGKDVSLKLVLQSESTAARLLSINISIQAMRYNGSPAANISSEVKDETLQPGKALSIPILVPFSTYKTHMLECDSMKISAIVTDKRRPDNTYLAVNDIVLENPPLSITVPSLIKVNREASGEVLFMNPVNELLKDCSLILSGSGLLDEEVKHNLPDLRPSSRVRIKFFFVPQKIGDKTLIANFTCSTFRNIKSSCTVNVKP
ncbi:protein-glutamine gamma-glutamyltransferase 2 isoform X1 [Mastacembelus armatus]|nr:protein-glutamine gamma-glutamyltransferase 2-like isoform X1 [Mastacembelus armatus]